MPKIKCLLEPSWNHTCAIHPKTIKLLLVHQSQSLVNLQFDRYTSGLRDINATNLSQLRLPCLDLGPCQDWPLRAITDNLVSLNHLALGFETMIAKAYANDEPQSDSVISDRTCELGDNMNNHFLSERPLPHAPLALNHLELIGLNLYRIINGSIGILFNVCPLKTLVIHSCSGISDAFTLLKVQDPILRHAAGLFGSFQNLKNLEFRYEISTPDHKSILETFVVSLPPLVSLQVLLDGCTQAHDLEPILKIHGKSLRTLVWDERSGRRLGTWEDTSIILEAGYNEEKNLETIARQCPNLVSLGLSLNWRVHHATGWEFDVSH